MSEVFIASEAKAFCLLVIAFLFIFKTRFLGCSSRRQTLTYLFAFFGTLGAFVTGFVLNKTALTCCFAGIGVCYTLAAFFLLPQSKAWAFAIVSFLFGIASFCSFRLGLGAASYILVVALIIAFAIEQYNKIRVDNLTKLYNRYGMDIELKEQLQQYKRDHNDSFYIIACDLDNFKHINDTWGHLEGDRALVLIAGALSKVGKEYNSGVFRIGGDEFVIITDTSEEGLALDITKAIQKELDNIDFRDDFDIKISIGTALYDGVTSISDLLNAADKKLYEAKKQGK